MAKKGGTSEINGFIKTDDPNKTKQKLSTRISGTVTSTKSNTSKSIKNDQLDDGIKSTKVISKDTIGKKTKQESIVTKVTSKDATGNNKKQVSSVTKVINKDAVVNKKKLESSVTKVSQSSVNSSPNAKNQVYVNVSKTNTARTKSIKETPRQDLGPYSKINVKLSTGQKTSNKHSVSEDVPKSKKSINSGERGTSLTGTSNSEKIHRASSKDAKAKGVSKDSVEKERKNVSKTSKTEVSKKSLVKKTESNQAAEKNPSDKVSTRRSSISTKNSNIVKRQDRVNPAYARENNNKSQSKPKDINQEQKQNTDDSEPKADRPDAKVESYKEDGSVKSNYKDMIYFEVDMADSKPPTNRVQSARTKSATSQPGTITRQGTFTKDDSSTSSEAEVQSVKEPPVEESHSALQDNNEEVEYEDDFEDYESDFEEYTSESESESGLSSKSETDSQLDEVKPSIKTEPVKVFRSIQKVVEEERKLDSGNYDLSSKTVFSSSIKQKQLDLIREAISKENTSLSEKRKRSIIPVEEKKEENKVVVLDFISALKKKEHVQQVEKEKHRSSIILQMISLHEQKIDLFDYVFSDDDVLADIYQNKNVSHASSQTNTESHEEASQTHDIVAHHIWTQCPISYHSWSKTSFSFTAFMEDQRGYGGDNLIIDYKSWWNTKYNAKKLYNFIDSASKVILIMLEEEASWRSSKKNMSTSNANEDLGFSDGCISLQPENLTFLQERPICDVVFSPHDSNIFVSSHRFAQDIEKLPSFTDQFFGRSILCVWNMLQPSQPLYLLVASCQICAVTFDSEYDHFVYAGLTDGSVCLWDLNESSIYHKESTAGSMEYLLRTPTFCTSYLAGKDYHHNLIVSMISIGYESYGSLSSRKFNPTQLITLDTDGTAVLWIVTPTLSAFERVDHSFDKIDYGISHWGKFKLVMGKTLHLESILPDSERKWGLQFLSMNLGPKYACGERKHMKSILVGTNIGNIIHFNTTEDEVDVPVFSNELGDNYATSVMCLERNPNGYPLFMAGCNDGNIRFYILNKPQPFKIISFDEDFVYTPIIKIRWSPKGLGLFFALDKNFSLHFWDICKDDHFPQISVSLKALQAAHFDVTCDEKSVYIGMSVQRFKIDIHRVKDKFITTNSEEENEYFMKFVKNISSLNKESDTF